MAWFTFWAPWHPGLAAVDVRSAVPDRAEVAVEHFDQRLRCYELHIGVHHLAFNAFAGRASDQAVLAERLARLLA